jgi:FkbM family methyltransferase
MAVGKDVVTWALRQMGFQLTRLGPPADVPPASAAGAVPRGSTFAALTQAASAGRAPRTVIDVGAAFGEFSRQCFAVFPNAAYLLLEPLEEYRANLDRLKADIPHASVVVAAAAGHEGMRDINVHRDLVGSSLYLEQEDSAVDGTPRRVRTVSLDDVVASHRLEPPYLLKVDVQGAELDVLSGAETVLWHVEWAMLEVSFFEFFKGRASSKTCPSSCGRAGSLSMTCSNPCTGRWMAHCRR